MTHDRIQTYIEFNNNNLDDSLAINGSSIRKNMIESNYSNERGKF